MQQPYSIEKIKYLRRFVGLKYREIGELIGYSTNTIASMMYQIGSGRYSAVKGKRMRLLLTYILNDYILEKYGEAEFNRILKATDRHFKMKARESEQGRTNDENQAV